MKKKHLAITGISLVAIVKILLIISVVYIGLTMVTIKEDLQRQIDVNHKLTQELIIENQAQTQEQILELSNSLLSTQTDLTSQLNELKAEAGSDFSGIIAEVIEGVVSVGTDISQGSGFVIDDEGYVVTNAHVLSGGRYVRVLIYETNTWRPAELVGYNTTMDIAVLKVSGSSLDSLEFGNSDDLVIGEKVIALGNPLGLSFSVTEGIISGLEREGINKIPEYVQIDAPLNRGNSGGPLVNKKGEVIGINNFKIQGSENLGFALESDAAVRTINEIFEQNNETIRV